jgi:centromere protein C
LNGSRSPADVYERDPTPPRSQKRSHSQMDEKEDSGIGNVYDNDDIGAADDSVAFVNDNDGYDDDMVMDHVEQDPEIEQTNGEVQSSPILQKKKRSRINGVEDSMMNEDDMINQDEDPYQEVEEFVVPLEKNNTSSRPRKNNARIITDEDHVDEYHVESVKPAKTKGGRSRKAATSTSRDTSEEPKAKKRRGRPKKNDRDQMPPPPLPKRSVNGLYQETQDDESSQSPTSVEPEEDIRPAKRSKKASSAPLTERDINSRMQGPQRSLWSQNGKKPGSRTLQIMNENGPWQESTFVTKSGRRSIRPLEYWRGEEVQKTWDGEILDVWRAPPEEKSKPKPRARSGPRARKGSAMPSIQEDEVELEEWETKGEILTGLVTEWNNEQGIPDDEDYEVGTIRSVIQYTTLHSTNIIF